MRQYVSTLYLYDPVPIPDRILEATATEVRGLCGQFDLSYRLEDRSAYFARFRVESAEEVAELARASQDYWLERLYTYIELPDDLKINVQLLTKDEPWSFFVTSDANLATFAINAHPRHTFTRGQCKYIASHEIAGHAVQNPCWARAVQRDNLPAARQIHTTHQPLQPLAEGIAQALPYFLCPKSELDPEMMLAKKLRELRDMVLANAQLMLEGGGPLGSCMGILCKPFVLCRAIRDRTRPRRPCAQTSRACLSALLCPIVPSIPSHSRTAAPRRDRRFSPFSLSVHPVSQRLLATNLGATCHDRHLDLVANYAFPRWTKCYCGHEFSLSETSLILDRNSPNLNNLHAARRVPLRR